MSGGNPILGTAAGGTGFGDIGITFRGNLVQTVIPLTSYDGTSDTVRAARRLPVAVPSLGYHSGSFAGSSRSAPPRSISWARSSASRRPRPTMSGSAMTYAASREWRWAWLRSPIGFEPKTPLPVASLNVSRHDLPKATVGDIATGSTFAYTVAVSAINARLMVGKRFGGFERTGGGGADLIKGNYSIVFVDPANAPQPRADSTVSAMRS